MRCNRCAGLLIGEDFRSTDNDCGRVSYMRCVNCGVYRFAGHEDTKVEREVVHPLRVAA